MTATTIDAHLARITASMDALRRDVAELARLACGPPMPEAAEDDPDAEPCPVVELFRRAQ